MKRLPIALLLALLLAWADPSPAQRLLTKKPKTNPTQRVPELILTVKADADERKRQLAAEELRDYDTATFTEIVPVLADVLQSDKKMSVRLEALNSLLKIRPVTSQASQAIEKAAAEDDSWRVRVQAKVSLPKYHLAGHTPKKSDAAVTTSKTAQTQEPPLSGEPQATAPPLPTPAPMAPAVPRPLPQNVAPLPKTPALREGPALFPQ